MDKTTEPASQSFGAASPRAAPGSRAWPGVAVWLAGVAAMGLLDGSVDLANLAMVMVLSSALASLWLPGWAAVVAALSSVAWFNWSFVPPRYTFSVDLRQHALLLGAMLVVNAVVSALVIRQRRMAQRAQHHALREARLRSWGNTLRDAADPALHVGTLQTALQAMSGVPVALVVLPEPDLLPEQDHAGVLRVGEVDADERAGLSVCIREGAPLGPGTGRYEEQPDWYLPLRGRGVCLGAVVLRNLGPRPDSDELRADAQALCDQMGQALQRGLVVRQERQAREQAQEQAVRNALLAAISHDYRTPLATILGAASSLQDQAERLSLEQRRKLAASIAEEAQRLARLTDNTLQLARLDAPGVQLRCDWESAEEIVGTVLRRVRARDPARRVRARLEPGLPLLWCDATLMSQLLENLVENALKYSPAEAPVELLVRCEPAQAERPPQLVLAVRDRGPGIAPGWRERVFQVFQRGAEPLWPQARVEGRPGAGVGLAVCRAIARAHGGELTLRGRGHGGSSFECRLPVRAQPDSPSAAAPSAAGPVPLQAGPA
jgi:two-component system sensor histidine kinase KdpD